MINFIPYGKQFIDEDDINSVMETLKSDFLTTGPKIKEFEKELAKYCDAKYCVVVSNGTAALHLASMVLLNENDKVITTVNSFVSTSNCILYVNAKPLFVDIADDGNIDLDLCEEELKKDSSIKAIYIVHFSGKPINQNKLRYLKDKYNIKILEDCAHSLGAKFENIKSGSCKNSDCSILSFHPVKHITSGEGGAITTNDISIYEKLLELRTHGIIKKENFEPWYYEMNSLGFNYRITDIACSLGISQLKKLDSFIEKRKNIAQKYDKVFENNAIIKPLYFFDKNSSYHLYVIKINFKKTKIDKNNLFKKMQEKNIGIQVHYIPINKQPYYLKLGYGNEITPKMDKYYEQAISLPIYASLQEQEQEYVIKNLLEIINE